MSYTPLQWHQILLSCFLLESSDDGYSRCGRLPLGHMATLVGEGGLVHGFGVSRCLSDLRGRDGPRGRRELGGGEKRAAEAAAQSAHSALGSVLVTTATGVQGG